MNYILAVFRKTFTIEGRARRKEYWSFYLFAVIIQWIAVYVDRKFFVPVHGLEYGMFYIVFSIALALPVITVGIRRMHDVDRRGWFLLIPIYSLFLLISKGTEGSNRFGDDPLANVPAVEKVAASWKCPKCGYDNSNDYYGCRSCDYRRD